MISFGKNSERVDFFDFIIVPEHEHEEDFFRTNKIVQRDMICYNTGFINFEDIGVGSIIGSIE